MTEKELKKLNRYQLLKLLIIQTQRADNLEARLEDAKEQLNNLNVKISNLGSIAEASLELQGVFQSAQNAADMYIEAAKKQAEEIENEARKKSDRIIAEATDKANRIKGENDI